MTGLFGSALIRNVTSRFLGCVVAILVGYQLSWPAFGSVGRFDGCGHYRNVGSQFYLGGFLSSINQIISGAPKLLRISGEQERNNKNADSEKPNDGGTVFLRPTPQVSHAASDQYKEVDHRNSGIIFLVGLFALLALIYFFIIRDDD